MRLLARIGKRGADDSRSARCEVTDKRSLMARQFKTEYELESGRDAVPWVRKWNSMPMEGGLISGIGTL